MKTIGWIPSNVVLIVTPVDLGRIISIKQLTWPVAYLFEEEGTLGLRGMPCRASS
jgi:hypothetical protein